MTGIEIKPEDLIHSIKKMKEIKHVLTLEIISYNKKKGNSLEQCNQELDEMECDFDTAIKSITILYSLCDGCNDMQKDE